MSIPTKWRSYREHRLCDVISPYVYGTRNGVQALAHAHKHTASELLARLHTVATHSLHRRPAVITNNCWICPSVCVRVCRSVCLCLQQFVSPSVLALQAKVTGRSIFAAGSIARSLVHTCIRQPTGNEVASHFYWPIFYAVKVLTCSGRQTYTITFSVGRVHHTLAP